jgi:hypothetical protein
MGPQLELSFTRNDVQGGGLMIPMRKDSREKEEGGRRRDPLALTGGAPLQYVQSGPPLPEAPSVLTRASKAETHFPRTRKIERRKRRTTTTLQLLEKDERGGNVKTDDDDVKGNKRVLRNRYVEREARKGGGWEERCDYESRLAWTGQEWPRESQAAVKGRMEVGRRRAKD